MGYQKKKIFLNAVIYSYIYSHYKNIANKFYLVKLIFFLSNLNEKNRKKFELNKILAKISFSLKKTKFL